jgi:UDP-3-O-[3-hydroxymyristoyl] glucosamine N-acyltransferase
MPDARFFDTLSPLSVDALADRIGGEAIRGGERLIAKVAPLYKADTGAVAFLGDRKFLEALRTTSAACVIVHPGQRDDAPTNCAVILSREPQAAWARASQALHRFRTLDAMPDRGEVCEDDSVILEPGALIGMGARIGRGSRIGAYTVVGPGVQIGRDCQIGSHVTLTCALIGDRVKILSGAKIGEPGFGAAGSAEGPVDIPQLGRVILQDGVTVQHLYRPGCL